MKMHTLSPAPNSRTSKKRLGRGIGSGLGKTAAKGHKGQWARSGGGVRVGFEGGQMPLARRLPKRGFDNNWKKVYSIVNIGDLDRYEEGEVVNAESLIMKGILSKIEPYGVKILGNGELNKKLTVQANKISKSALEKLNGIGCTVEVL